MRARVKVEVIDNATEAVRAAGVAVEDAELFKIVARSAANLTVGHLERLASERHRSTSPFNFYGRAAAGTTADSTSDAAMVRIVSEGIAQRFFGGLIEPSGRISTATGKPITRIAIPVEGSPAEGHVAADFDDLFCVVYRNKTKAALARKSATGLQWMYWLVESVDQEEDPTVLPTDEEYLDAVGDDIAYFVIHAADRAGGQEPI